MTKQVKKDLFQTTDKIYGKLLKIKDKFIDFTLRDNYINYIELKTDIDTKSNEFKEALNMIQEDDRESL